MDVLSAEVTDIVGAGSLVPDTKTEQTPLMVLNTAVLKASEAVGLHEYSCIQSVLMVVAVLLVAVLVVGRQ